MFLQSHYHKILQNRPYDYSESLDQSVRLLNNILFISVKCGKQQLCMCLHVKIISVAMEVVVNWMFCTTYFYKSKTRDVCNKLMSLLWEYLGLTFDLLTWISIGVIIKDYDRPTKSEASEVKRSWIIRYTRFGILTNHCVWSSMPLLLLRGYKC